MPSIISVIHRPRLLREDGLHRRIHDGLYSETVVEALCQLSTAARGSEHTGLTGLLNEVSDVVAGSERPIDASIRQFLIYTDPDHVKRSFSRGGRNIRNRIAVATQITARGNLSVTISPDMLTEDGRFDWAPEWIHDPFPSYSEVMQRPHNEVLFIRDVERWFQPYKHDDAARAALRNAACSAINMAFWLTMHRLSQVFSISYRSYLAGVADTPQSFVHDNGRHIGLEIVNALFEARSTLEESIRVFEEVTGHAPSGFYHACNETDGWRRFEAASRKLRKAPGCNHLTPKVVENYGLLLEKAVRYGVWSPDQTELP